MFSRGLVALAAAISTASAATYQGFNYGSDADFSTQFALAKSLVGTSGDFTSARIYTMIEPGSTNTPTSAIPAAIANDVTLLLGLWASGGQADLTNEIAALTSAITQYGTAFTSRVAGISVGSEDLYRISPTGVINKSGVGAEPDVLVDYINQVKSAISGTSLSSAPVGHVDTWTAWVNGSNDAVINACDFIGMDAYPYFQNLQANAISNAYDLFFSAYDQTIAATNGKPVWVTETGWPVSGPAENDAIASVANAKTYWDQVACKLLGTTTTYWYTLIDAGASPSFGLTDGSSTPVFDLSCGASSSSSSAASTASSVKSSATSGSASTTATGSSASSASASSTAVVAQTSVPVSSSAIASGGGSPADTTSASADSSAASFQSASSSAFSSAVASASSALVSASSALSAATTATSASAAGSASVASASSVASAASSAIATSSSVAISTLVTETGSSSSPSTASGSSATAVSGTNSTYTSASPVPTYTGAASTVRSTGGFVAALVAVLAFL